MTASARTSTTRLTVAQALVRFLSVQYTERDGVRQRLIGATWGIFGHGNVAGIGQALVEYAGDDMPYHQGRNEQAMVHAAVGYARQSNRLSAHAVTTSIGPGATNLVTGAALATINHLPVLLLPGDIFATRPADPVLQQLEVPYAGDVSVNDCLRPVSRYFDRVTRPEALIPAALQAMRVLTDPVETGAVTLALPQDVQAEAYDWPEEFFAERVWAVRRPGADPAELADAVRAVRVGPAPPDRRGRRRPPQPRRGGPRRVRRATGIPVASTQAGKGSLRHDHPAGRRRHRPHRHRHRRRTRPHRRPGDRRRHPLHRLHHRLRHAVRQPGRPLPQPQHRRRSTPTSSPASRWSPTPAARALGSSPSALEPHRHRVDRRLRERVHRGQGALGAARRRLPTRPTSRTSGPPRPRSSAPSTRWSTSDDILINAAGSLPGDLHKLWRARSRDQYHVEYGYSCMGYEIPAAIGVKLAAPDRPVWALVGDGTYLMMPTEIVTAVQEGIADQARHPARTTATRPSAACPSRWAASGSAPPTATGPTTARTPGPRCPSTSPPTRPSLGMRVLRAKTVRDLREALAEARAADRPTCVYVETETADTVSGAPPAQAWWDVPVAETATRPSAVKAREEYDTARLAARRRHL